MERLPFVRYTAVGINIAVAIIDPNPEESLIKKFLILESCSTDDLKLESVSLRFVYPVDNGRLNLTCEPGKFDDGKSRGIIVSANYHTDCLGENKIDEVKGIIQKFPDRSKHFEETVLRKLFLEGKRDGQ